MENRKPSILVLAIAAAAAVTGLAFVAPTLILIKEHHGVTSNEAQLIITSYLLAISTAQIFWGPISERFGRRPILIVGAFLYTVGAFLGSYDQTFFNLILFRFLQGLGAGACLSMPRVMITDVYSKSEAAGKLSLLLATMAIFPVLSVSLGGVSGEKFGWQFNFHVMFFFGILILFGNFLYTPETIKSKVNRLSFIRILLGIKGLFENRNFLYLTTVSSIQAAAFFSMAGFMPYQFERLGASPSEFGMWFALTSLGYISGNIFSSRVSKKIELVKISLFGCCWSFLAIFSMSLCLIEYLSFPITLAMACFMYGLGNGLVISNVVVLSLSSVERDSTGLANGLMGAMQMASGGLLGSLIIFAGGDENFFKAISCLLLLSLVATFCCFVVYNKRLSPT